MSVLNHQFSVDVAKEVGINSAIIMNHIVFWVDHNKSTGRAYNEGKFWTYATMKAIKSHFPYLTTKQVRTALDRLKEAGYLEVGNFNKSPYDRTAWYTLTPKASITYGLFVERTDEVLEEDLEVTSESLTSAPQGKSSIRYINKDKEEDSNSNSEKIAAEPQDNLSPNNPTPKDTQERKKSSAKRKKERYASDYKSDDPNHQTYKEFIDWVHEECADVVKIGDPPTVSSFNEYLKTTTLAHMKECVYAMDNSKSFAKNNKHWGKTLLNWVRRGYHKPDSPKNYNPNQITRNFKTL